LLNSNYLETKMITCIRKAVAAACLVVAAGAAHAAVDPLQSALITASYSGGGMLGNDHLYADEAGSNISALDPFNTSAEFLTGDYLFAFDFAPNGTLTIYNNGAVPSGAYSASFDFGATLGAAITGFSVTDAGLTSGTSIPRARARPGRLGQPGRRHQRRRECHRADLHRHQPPQLLAAIANGGVGAARSSSWRHRRHDRRPSRTRAPPTRRHTRRRCA
jgi:hypothetical protein